MSQAPDSRPSILVCEDDFASRKLLTRMLMALGTVDTASNGQEAVEAVRDARAEGQHYDIICLDVQMPELDGQSALQAIRKMEADNATKQNARILMTTASNCMKQVTAAFRSECDGYLVKPIRREAILGKLAEFGYFPED